MNSAKDSNQASMVHQQIEAMSAIAHPGAGATIDRWAQLARWAAQDMAMCKILEAHYDALAILSDLDQLAVAEPKSIWAVWAANAPHQQLRARHFGTAWALTGSKPWCSGFDVASNALVTCTTENGPALMAVASRDPSIHFDDGDWVGLGMRNVRTATATFAGTPATWIATATDYLDRPGFWHGGAGIAACWWGATAAVAETLRRTLRSDRPHAAAQLGNVQALVCSVSTLLRALATEIDDDAGSPHLTGVLTVRLLANRAAAQTVQRVNDTLGPGPLCSDSAHAQRCADLLVWIRQHHSGTDEATLGTLVSKRGEGWCL